MNFRYSDKVKEYLWGVERMHMAAYKYPRLIEFRKQFFMTSSGKILWRTLQEEEKE